jgi:hypothetical protein
MGRLLRLIASGRSHFDGWKECNQAITWTSQYLHVRTHVLGRFLLLRTAWLMSGACGQAATPSLCPACSDKADDGQHAPGKDTSAENLAVRSSAGALSKGTRSWDGNSHAPAWEGPCEPSSVSLSIASVSCSMDDSLTDELPCDHECEIVVPRGS